MGHVSRALAINARASAGARMVEAREALARVPKTATLARLIAEERLTYAEIDYAAAFGVEKSFERGDHHEGERGPKTAAGLEPVSREEFRARLRAWGVRSVLFGDGDDHRFDEEGEIV